MPTTKNKAECHICHKIVNAQGLGSHLRLKHGIIEHKVKVEVVPDSTQSKHEVNLKSTQVNSSSTQSQHKLTQVDSIEQHELPTQVNISSIQIKRPSDYVKKNEKVISIEHVSAFEKKPECVDGECLCTICRKKLQLQKCYFKRNPSMDGKAVICNDCLKKFKKDDLHGEWWHVPNTNNLKINVTSDYFQTESCRSLPDYLKKVL